MGDRLRHAAHCSDDACRGECIRPTPDAWTADEIERAGRHLGATSKLVALAICDVLRDPPKEWRR